MKVHKMFCIEEDIALFLKGTNGSKLVNELLAEHMKKLQFKGLSLDELKKKKAQIEAKKEYEAKLKDIANGKLE